MGETDEGVTAGNLEYVENEDGTRTYDQELVETVDEPEAKGSKAVGNSISERI